MMLLDRLSSMMLLDRLSSMMLLDRFSDMLNFANMMWEPLLVEMFHASPRNCLDVVMTMSLIAPAILYVQDHRQFAPGYAPHSIQGQQTHQIA
jgi:hypothetical protein